MKKILFLFSFLSLTAMASKALAVPVFSANGFICGKEGTTVTCKGPIPGGTDTVTGTGHDLVYLTINSTYTGQPLRYTYFSDTGCLIGYAFNAAGQPAKAVATHRNGAQKTFDFSEDQGKYETVINYCIQENPSKTASAAPSTTGTSPKTTAPVAK